MKNYTVLIAGGSGLIGQNLKQHLERLNVTVRILSRKKNSKFYWNPKQKKIDEKALDQVDVVVNLCGLSVDRRWTKKNKFEILSSRIHSTDFLIYKLNQRDIKIKKYIGVSATGYYNYDGTLKTESSKQGDHYLSKVCSNWESQINKLNNTSFCLLRLGVVLSKEGGMLKKLLFPFSLNLGASLGSGKQLMSWVHIDDVSRMIIHCVKIPNNEIFNCVSPNVVTNEFFSKTFSKSLKKKIWLPSIPSALLKLIFGEMSTMILGSINASSKKIERTGFAFKFPKLKKAIEDLLN